MSTKPDLKSKAFFKELSALIKAGVSRRDRVASYVNAIDLELEGAPLRDEEEAKIEADNKAGNIPEFVPERLELVNAQLDEAISYCMGVIGEQNKLYTAVDSVDRQKSAEAMAALMNLGASNFDHYSAIKDALFCGFRYNLYIQETHWKEITGNVLRDSNDAATNFEPMVEEAVVVKGNELKTISPANFISDARVEPTKLAVEGQYYGTLELTSEFALAREGIKLPAKAEVEIYPEFNLKYNKTFLDSQITGSDEGEPSTLDLFMPLPGEAQVVNSLTKFNLYFKWKLKDKYQLFKLVFINGVPAQLTQLTNPHGMLPVAVAILSKGKSYAKKLLPFQNAATTKLNLHIDSLRKAIYGTLYYNEKLFPELGQYSPIASRIPFNPSSSENVDLNGRDLRYISESPNTQDTFNHLELMDALMQRILPTATSKGLAGLDRATRYQAASLVASSNQTLLMILRSVHAQALSPLVNMQMYNIIRFQDSETVLNVSSSSSKNEDLFIDISRKDLLSFGGELNIGTGLKGLDRYAETELLRDIVGLVIQSQHAIKQTDFIKLMNHYTSVAGDLTDFEMFRKQPADSASQAGTPADSGVEPEIETPADLAQI